MIFCLKYKSIKLIFYYKKGSWKTTSKGMPFIWASKRMFAEIFAKQSGRYSVFLTRPS
jgi:hypothetical protein